MVSSPAGGESDRSPQAAITRPTGRLGIAARVADWLWCVSILIALWLPLLSGLGYRLPNTELLILILLSSVLAATIVTATARTSTFRLLFLSVTVFATLDLYALDITNWILAVIIFAIIVGSIWVMRDHASRIIGVGSLAFSVAVLATASPMTPPPFTFGKPIGSAGQAPSIIHLILDEHGGAGGLPEEIFGLRLKADSVERYQRYGFRAYTNVRASSGQTQISISSLMNGHATPPKSLQDAWGGGRFRKPSRSGSEYEMDTNKYLAEAIARGYQVHVLQSSFLDMCPEPLAARIDCRTYPHNSAAILGDLKLPLPERALILLGLTRWSLAGQRVSFLYEELSKTGPGETFSNWILTNAPGRLHPLVASHMLDYISRQILSAPRGQLFVVHLLLPHRPYVFDEKCNVLPAAEWIENKIESSQLRREIYLRYYEQMVCTDTRIGQFIETALRNPLLADATFIVHGDHGSRNGAFYRATIGPTYSKNDYDTDYFTTLFAVRSPATAPGATNERMGLTDIFWASLESAFAANGEMAQAQ